MSAPAVPPLFGRRVRHVHCVGVGGMGLGPLAIYLAQLGFSVTGEDDAMTPEMSEQLTAAGVALTAIRSDCELLAYSSAIAQTHPAYQAAVARAVPLVRRGELLAEVTRHKKLVAICGSHGKTTTTAMLIAALRHARFPAGYILGGLFADRTPPAAAGGNEWVVAEIDESDGTIERFSPELTVAVNLDWDHPDHYRRLADIEAAFAALFQRTRGPVLVSDACAMSARVVKHVDRGPKTGAAEFFTFGRQGDFSADIASEAADHMVLRLGGKFTLSEATVRANGEFNAFNAAAALAAAQLMTAGVTADALAGYPAVRRRQSVLHRGDITVIEDYAHHPAEIRALLASLRRRVTGRGRLIAVFQPHRFSRTAQFKTEFAATLATADRVYLIDVYSAGEAPVPGGSASDVQTELQRIAPARVGSSFPADDAALFAALAREVQPGDVVAFVGAGDIDKKARAWLASQVQPAENSAARGAPARAAGLPRDLSPQPAARWDAFLAEVKPLLAKGAKLQREESLAAKTTIRVGGAARLYAEPASLADLQTLLREADARQVPVFILGRGSNLVVPDAGVEGLVISLGHEAWAKFEVRRDGRIWAGAGLRLKNLCGLAAKARIAGFEFLEGIPGSVGGALRMNAGAMGGWMFDVVDEVELITFAGEVRVLAKAAMHVEYRHCAELREAIALGALLRPASVADAEAIKRQMDTYAKKRHESQPREPSAGCMFKNPPGTSAGRLIDECGLKGERVGDAEVSPVHANFIVNRGQATSADVLELMRRVRARVHAAKGIKLEPEVLLYGKNWEDVL
jgi:UDP-N-acetylmuramate--alanine ligase